MENIILEIFAEDNKKAIGFREMEPSGPAGRRFGLYLPSKENKTTSWGQIVDIVQNNILDNLSIDFRINYITVNDGDYSRNSNSVMGMLMEDFPMSENCRVNVPAKLIWGQG